MYKYLVEDFYNILWNNFDNSNISTILDKEITFRGSLGDEKKGHKGFWEYVKSVHNSLEAYECIIEDLIEEDNKIVAKMVFKGKHVQKFLDYEASNKIVQWNGVAIFTIKNNLIKDIWVLGDLKNLENQLKSNSE